MPNNNNRDEVSTITAHNCKFVNSTQHPGRDNDNEFALVLHAIPKRLLLDDPPTDLLEAFALIMRGDRNEIDTDAVDITLDPFASQYVWHNMTSPALHRFPDLLRLATQLGGHIPIMFAQSPMFV